VYRVLPNIFQPGLPRWTSSQISIHRGVSLEGHPPTETCSTRCANLRQFLVTGSDRAHSCALPPRRASGASYAPVNFYGLGGTKHSILWECKRISATS
jgi:hypothetical protein